MVQETSESLILPKTAGRVEERMTTVCVYVFMSDWVCVRERERSEQVFAHSQGAGLLIMVGMRVGGDRR